VHLRPRREGEKAEAGIAGFGFFIVLFTGRRAMPGMLKSRTDRRPAGI